MKTIIAGSREITDLSIIERAVKESQFEITSVTSGGCRGVDRVGEQWASKNKIPVEVITANWDTFGKAAGYIRNEEMAQRSEALIAIWKIDKDGNGSKGTRNMISIAKRHGLKVYVLEIRDEPEIKSPTEGLPLFNESETQE